ncbi:Acyl-coenzyme A thioesterase PaaI [Thalassovita autumnalis]|uniref:Acyl-coenzyme A thioesterase PaaI n=1 Tax=Thalassovita autumnalis TaxID=2072972 RepID=A0A0P1FWI0_9RHOB|nr:PaaI family thioesterase [Thalassovita autumnalis]CUH68035.1 Acyl-coenzyme A thioesterase PaaI [Thalassovita autumnalis]CUH73317.1 Acyl-coenzyme A thioesterase PaaI [Thalassovita autumnalis]
MKIQSRVSESFAKQTMMQTLGAELIAADAGLAVIEAQVLPTCQQQHGFGHAGLTFSIGDSAAGYAALSAMPEGYEVLTSEIKINLLAPAAGDRLIARGKVVKPGKRLVVVTAEVFARDGDQETLIALMQGTMVPMAPR